LKCTSAENSEKHLSNVCYQLKNQVEDLKLQLKLAEEKNKLLEFDFNSIKQKCDYFMYGLILLSLKKENS
jgi:hypothetical protein